MQKRGESEGEKKRSVYPSGALVSSQGGESSLKLVWSVIVRGRWIIATVTFLFACAVFLYSLAASPVYRAGTYVAARGHFDKEALALLRSRDFLEDFVREKDILYLIFPRRWDRINDQWAVKASQVPNLQEGADLLQKQLISKRKKRAGLLYIGIDYSDPHAAAAIVNRVLMYLNERIKEEALEKAARRDAYYERKLFRHDSLLVHRLDSLVAMLPDMPAGAVLGNAGDSSVDDAMLKKFLKAISLKEREKLVAEKQSNNNIIMRANLAAEEFAFKAYEEARAPKERIWPKTPFIFAMAIATGIFSGFLIAFIKEVAVQPVRDGS